MSASGRMYANQAALRAAYSGPGKTQKEHDANWKPIGCTQTEIRCCLPFSGQAVLPGGTSADTYDGLALAGPAVADGRRGWGRGIPKAVGVSACFCLAFQTVRRGVGPPWTPPKQHILTYLSSGPESESVLVSGSLVSLQPCSGAHRFFSTTEDDFENTTFDQRSHLTGKHWRQQILLLSGFKESLGDGQVVAT